MPFKDQNKLDSKQIQKAAKIIVEAFIKDPDFYRTYIDNVAIILYDRFGITDKAKRDTVADEIMKRIFFGK